MEHVPTRRELLAAAAALVLASASGPRNAAWAQPLPPGNGPQRFEQMRLAGDAMLVMRTAWSARDAGGRRTATVTLERATLNGTVTAQPFEIYRGPPVLGAMAARPGSALVALYNGGDAAFVEVLTVDLAAASASPAAPWTVRRRRVPRAAGDGFAPAQAVAAPDGEGFTLLWQEHRRQVGGARVEARTWMARVPASARPEGADWLDAPREVPVPWSLAALGANAGGGYLLAIRFDGSTPGQTRLCLVTLSPSGQPEQHPWWASAPEALGEVQIGPDGGGLAVYYAGGRDGAALRAVASTAVGSWGREPEAPRELGRLAARELFALGRSAAGGAATLVRNIPRAPRR